MRKTIAVLFLTAVAVFGSAGSASAHQHLSAPSGDCAAEGSSVPQRSANPGGNTPGNVNNAAGNEQGTAHCP
jgi:hypothetical protein